LFFFFNTIQIYIVQNKSSPLEIKPFTFKSSLTPSNLTRKISNSHLYDIKINNTIPDFKDDPLPKNLKNIKKPLENHLKPINPITYKSKKHKIISETQKIEEKLEKIDKSVQKKQKNNNKSINNIRNSKEKKIERRIATSMSTRFPKNISKNMYNEIVNSKVSIPYLNNNQYSLGIRGRDIMNWDMSGNINVFNTPSIYTSLPFLMENREFGQVSKNLLVDLLK